MFKQIVIPVDLDELAFADKAMSVALRQAEEFNAKLHIISVVPGYGMPMVGSFFPKDAMGKAFKTLKKRLQDYAGETAKSGVKVSSALLEGSKPYKVILKEAKKVGADLIVIPSHNYRRVDKILLGSCTSRVVERAKMSVMVIKP
ncbi:MAG: universal stress protein [Pseudomonadales bacterium]|nr:universal stress protein [Pseudomonadales bacterium]